MTIKKRQKLKNFLVNYLFLVIIISGTALYFIFHPEHIYRFPNRFQTNYVRFDRVEDFVIVPANKDTLVISYHQKGIQNKTNSVCIKYRELDTWNLKEMELQQLFCKNIYDGNLSNLFYDEHNKTVYTIFARHNSEYYLFKLWENGKIASESSLIFDYELHKELRDSTITIKGVKFYGAEYSHKTYLSEYADGFKFAIAESEKDQYRTVSSIDFEDNDFTAKLAEITSQKLKIEFSNSDIYTIFAFFRRNSHYQKSLFKGDRWKDKGFLHSHIMGMIDGNNDGKKDLLIKIDGRRWINYQLLCYDVYHDSLLWRRSFSEIDMINFQVTDLDNDGLDEIMFTSYAPANEMPIDWYEHPDAGFSNQSYFRILTNTGENKMINEKPIIVESDIWFCAYRYPYLKKQNKILLGLFKENDSSERKIQILDLKTNKIINTGIKYHSILGFFQDKDICYIDISDGNMIKNTLKKDLSVSKRIVKNINKNYFLIYHEKFEILGREFYLNNRLVLIDEKLNFIDYDKQIPFMRNIKLIGNTLYFTEKGNDRYYLSSLSFSRNKSLNPVFLLIVIFELILILMYYYFR